MDAGKIIEQIIFGAGQLRAHAEEIDQDRKDLNELRHILMVIDDLRSCHGLTQTDHLPEETSPARGA